MKYRARYGVIGVDYSGQGSFVFEADTDAKATEVACAGVSEREAKQNAKVKNQFEHEQFELVELRRILREEVSVPVPF